MAGITPFYGLSYFTFGDDLGDGINVQREIDRFLVIDKQLYGLYVVFGDGVIQGWEITERNSFGSNAISVDIGPGIGIIGGLATQTDSSGGIDELPPNETFYIYAVLSGGTIRTRDVDFVWSRTLPTVNAIRLARVTTGETGITEIDTDFRQEISFLEFIKDEVAKHKHRGSPSKIDLQTETRNQLPGARIQDFDAAKVNSGRLSPERIPQLDHNDLANTGLLTHAALDSFTKLINSGNRQLLGEIGAVNTMKLITAQHYIASTNNLNLSDLVDFPNLLVCYPGITPDTAIDFDASTSNIDLSTHCISGKPVQDGSITSIYWNSNAAFFSATDRQNVTIARDTVSLTRGSSSSTQVEDFEQVPRAGVAIPGFTTQVQITTDRIGVVSEDSSSLKTQGFYSGKFQTERESRIIYKRAVSQNRDWSLFDELILDVKSLTISHGAVYMYFVSGTGENAKQSQSYLVLGQDEITDNVDPDFNAFERRVFDISSETRDDIQEIVFYTDDTITKHEFWVDNIFIRNQSLFPPSGLIRFRYSSGVPVVFSAINYEASIPEGCDVRIRVRVANSTALLNRAVFTPNIKSGDVFSLYGTDAEIEAVLVSNTDRTKTPSLTSIELQLVVDSEITGFTISTAEEWDRGSYTNEKQSPDEYNTAVSKITIEEPISVGDLYYIYQNGVNENDPDGAAVYGFRGLLFRTLLSPQQAINIADASFSPGFNKPFSVYRLANRNFVIADTINDRIIETNPRGEFVRGLGGHHVTDSAYFYPLSAVYNTRTGILSVAFSQEVDSTKIEISKIRLWIGSASILLGNEDEILDNGKTAKLLEIRLTNDKVEQLQDPNFDVYVDLLSGFLPTPFDFPDSARRLISNKGLLVFLGDFVYMNDVKRPIFANVMANGEWMVCNSTIEEEDVDSGDATNITLKVGESTNFTVTVDPPGDGFELRWERNVPSEIQGIFTFEAPSPGNVATVYLNSPTDSQIRTWQLLFTAVYIETATGQTIATTTNTVILTIVAADSGTEEPTTNEAPSLVQIDVDNEEVKFSYSGLVFSDFTLGSVYEVDSEKILVSGLVLDSDPLPAPEGGEGNETYEEQAIRKLTNYRGKTIILNRRDKSVTFTYDASDNSYPSDAVLDENSNVVIAETSFIGNAGRVIKVDADGNIVWQVSGGLFSKINDVRAKFSGDVVVST